MGEHQKRELEAANAALSAAAEADLARTVSKACAESSKASGSENATKTATEELAELRLLNEQLIERLGRERTEHTQSKQSLTAALDAAEKAKAQHVQTKVDLGATSRENETLSIRLE